jgi:hypothetical protein
MNTQTRSMCPVCYQTVPAERRIVNGAVVLVKRCPTHGETTVVREPNARFYGWMADTVFDADAVAARTQATMINTTDRCNMACPQCYHQPDKGPDPPISDVVDIARLATKRTICLLGAESTVRVDLPELVSAIREETGKRVALYTNGVKLASRRYLVALADAGLTSTAVSLQFPEYVGRELYEAKLRAISNLRHSPVGLWHVAFSICKAEDVGPALDAALSLDLPPETYIRMRVTGAIGTDLGTPMALSELVHAFNYELVARGLTGRVMKGSHPYVLIVKVGNRDFFLLRWPSVDEIDLDDLTHAPARGLLMPELGELPLVQSMLLFAHMRKGRSIAA